jgi:hypothetical protein
MTLLHEAVEAKKFDVRTIERNVARGVITRDDADKALKKLADDGDNAEWVNVEKLEAEGEDGEDTASAPQAQHSQPGTSH